MTMNRTFALAFACGASLCVPANADDAGPARGPVSVFVTPATPYEIPTPELDVLKKEANAALQAFDKEVEEVRKAHGKEWAKWPWATVEKTAESKPSSVSASRPLVEPSRTLIWLPEIWIWFPAEYVVSSSLPQAQEPLLCRSAT